MQNTPNNLPRTRGIYNMARNKSSHKQNIWNDVTQRFELRYINPTKAGRRKSRHSLKRKKA